jgi:flavin-dependent dehydrogenase
VAGLVYGCDAAATFDPTSSHGVLRAVASGIMAARLTSAVIRGVAPPQETAAAYRDWLLGWSKTDAAALSRFYRDLNAPAFASPRPCYSISRATLAISRPPPRRLGIAHAMP